jgi:hypothetical protein
MPRVHSPAAIPSDDSESQALRHRKVASCICNANQPGIESARPCPGGPLLGSSSALSGGFASLGSQLEHEGIPPMHTLLSGILFVVSFVCFVMVVMKMFQHGKTVPAIASAALFLCFGIGYLIAFVYGWMNATEWNIKNIMLAWTACIVIGIVAGMVFGVPQVPALNQ